MDEGDGQLLTPRERAVLERNPTAKLVADPTGSAQKHASSHKPELYGVGGWLAFLAISLSVLGPLVSIAATGSEIARMESQFPQQVGSSEWTMAVGVAWAITLAYCAISIFAGYRLFKHHVPSTVPIVIGCIWVAGPVLGIIAVLFAGSDQTASAEVIKSIISCSIWTAYLLRSRRVKNTYISRQPDDALVETFE